MFEGAKLIGAGCATIALAVKNGRISKANANREAIPK